MFRIKPAARLSLTIGFVSLSLGLLALGLGLIPDPNRNQIENRLSLVRTCAISISTLAETNQQLEIQRVVERIVSVEPNVRSIALCRNQQVQSSNAQHSQQWQDASPQDQAEIDILCNGKRWAILQVLFHPSVPPGLWGQLTSFPIPLVAFLFSAMTLICWYVLARTFHYLNPASVVPDRVRNALDSIGSGLALITPQGEIAHTNKAFERIVQMDSDKLVGRQIDQFPWTVEIDFQRELPWNRCRKFHESVAGEIVQAKFSSGVVQKYMVSATPIFAATNQFRGVLISFEDVTALEAKKSELAKVIQSMRLSRDEVQRQNEQLHFLANFDPLTRCMNRRSFYIEYENLWNQATDNSLALLILDIDYFKKINDNYGHSTGDEVLREVGAILISMTGDDGIVCRYGGEEFVIISAKTSFASAVDLAERIRVAVETKPIAGLSVTTSIGVSSKSFGAMDCQHLLDQADACLYAAKRHGRNQVVRYDQIRQYQKSNEAVSSVEVGSKDVPTTPASQPTGSLGTPSESKSIEYSSVSGLLSALSFRSRSTAEHSIRVADLAVDLGRSKLTGRELYYLEIAGLLHDVGKIGVPDSILNKSTKLTEDEWEIMRRHDEIGVAIVRSAFDSTEVSGILEAYYRLKNGVCSASEEDHSQRNLCAQILYLCDAFDSMISGSVYREGMTVPKAIEEVLRNTPSQFHPDVVKELVEFAKCGRLGNAAESLHRRSENSDNTPVGFSELKQPDNELEQIVDLANGVMDLHQETRSALKRPESPSQLIR